MKCVLFLAFLVCAFITSSEGVGTTVWGVLTNNRLQNETIISDAKAGLIQSRNITLTTVSG